MLSRKLFLGIIGIVATIIICSIAYALGFSPKPELVKSGSSMSKALRICGFWLTIGIFVIMTLIRFAFLFASDPVLATFITIILITFFGLLFRQFAVLSQIQPLNIRIANERDMQTASNNFLIRASINHSILKKAMITGVICGILLLGFAYGIPLGYYLGTLFGTSIGLTVSLIFILFGTGYGAGCGAIFASCYGIKPKVAFLLERVSESRLQQIGLLLTILGILLTALPSLL